MGTLQDGVYHDDKYVKAMWMEARCKVSSLTVGFVTCVYMVYMYTILLYLIDKLVRRLESESKIGRQTAAGDLGMKPCECFSRGLVRHQ